MDDKINDVRSISLIKLMPVSKAELEQAVSNLRREHGLQVPYLIQAMQPSRFVKGKGYRSNPYGTDSELDGFNEEFAAMSSHWLFYPSYMGAAEFEWGAIPRSIAKLLETQNGTFTYRAHNQEAGAFIEGRYTRFKTNLQFTAVAPLDKVEEYTTLMDMMFLPKWKNYRDFKECPGFGRTPAYYLEGDYDNDNIRVGWLDIDNNFMFFLEQVTLFDQNNQPSIRNCPQGKEMRRKAELLFCEKDLLKISEEIGIPVPIPQAQ
jgi:hypothetical protein